MMSSPMSLAPGSFVPDTSGSGRSRRSSVISTGSSGGLSKSRSLLSTGEGASAQPTISGNLQIISGVECGEQVVSVKNSENGSVTGESRAKVMTLFSTTAVHIQVVGLFGGQIKVYQSLNGNHIATLDPDDIDEGDKGSGPNSLLAATYVSGHLRIWNHASGKCVAQAHDADPDREYLCLSHNPFVDVIAVGLNNGGIKLYDEKTMQVVSLLQKSLSPSKVNGHTDRVFCIANHPLNPHEFVSSGWDNTLQFWDARCPNSISSVYGSLVCGEGLTFDKKGRELLVASWTPQNQLKIIDYSSKTVLENFEPELTPHYLTGAQFLGNDYILTSASNLGQVRVIDRQKKVTVASLSDIPHVYDMDISKKGVQQGNVLRFTITSNNNIVTLEFKK